MQAGTDDYSLLTGGNYWVAGSVRKFAVACSGWRILPSSDTIPPWQKHFELGSPKKRSAHEHMVF